MLQGSQRHLLYGSAILPSANSRSKLTMKASVKASTRNIMRFMVAAES
jgi:hypothetical protein